MSVQGSPEWRQERCGYATASCFDKVLAKVKVGEAMGRIKYRLQLVTERLTGNPVDGYQSAVMLRGIEIQPEAQMAYEALRGVIVEEVGFGQHHTIPMCGASPDGLVGEDGMIEVKCPDSTTHLAALEAGVVPPEHFAQMQGQMAVFGRAWNDFVSYDPRFPPNLQLFVVRLERNDSYITFLEAEIKTFLATVDAMEQRLKGRA